MSKPDLQSMFPNGSRDFFAQNAAQLNGTPKPRTVKIEVAPHTPVKKRLRQNATGLNKTEAAFLATLKAGGIAEASDGTDVLPPQSITLRIGNGVRYTPDFFTVGHEPIEDAAGNAQTLRAYEVKGFMRDDAAVKLKVAASLYPWIKFHLVSKRKGGGWDVQEVLP
jgi:hypothetical protein